jgi:pimeloyl-ACP methyl ester carboxylesterase
MVREGGDQALEADYAGRYRDDLATHPGCVPRDEYDGNVEFLISDNEATVTPGVPADIDGYPCAAKEYTQAAEDTDKPIVILVHGNSASVSTFEEYGNAARAGSTLTQAGSGFSFTVDATTREQLATRLVEEGYRVIAFDARTDLVASLDDFDADSSTGNAFRNIDHGWAVPMLQGLVKAVMLENPTRKVSLVGHSLGVTVIRDALRRLYLEHRAGEEGAVNPFAQTQDVILLSGANHGVNAGQVLCDTFDHMRGTVGCEMGDRTAFAPTYFSRPLNGPSDYYGAPCADGSFAYGMTDQCGGNAVHYTTVTMRDIAEGMLQDEFISEASSQIDLESCVDNELIELSDYDASGYFFTALPGLFANHFGSVRSDAGIALVLEKLAD